MGKWNNRSRFHRRRSPLRWYSERHSSYSSGYGEEDGIPVWEKKFCEVIGSVPWQKVVEANTFKSWYQGNVITWNDSACEETFINEKKRFWSQVNGLHYDISLPDPNLYISEVDWETYVDPELIRDLERAYFAPRDEMKSGSKREPQDENLNGCYSVPIEEDHMLNVQWKGSDKVQYNYADASGKKSNGWNHLEISTDRIKDKMRPWEAKRSCVNEKSRDCLSNQWETEKWRENDGWDNSEHQNKKAKGSESVSAEEYVTADNPWEAKPCFGMEISKDAAWGGCSGKGWEDRGWGSGGWENRDLGNQITEMKEWRSKGYSPWKVGIVPDNVALRDYRANAGSSQTWRTNETNLRNKERHDLYSYHSNYKNSRYRRNDHQNRKVNF